MKTKTNLALFTGALILALVLPSLATAQIISDFNAVGGSQGVFLQWTTARESGVVEFRLQRSFDGVQFHSIHTNKAVGAAHTYYYTDNNLFKGPQQTFYYRIEIALPDDQVSYSNTEVVSLNFSGIQRTWGSIKAMFR